MRATDKVAAQGVRKAAGLGRAALPRTSPSGELESSAREAGLPLGIFGWISVIPADTLSSRRPSRLGGPGSARASIAQGAPWRVRLRHGGTPGGVCNVGGGPG